MTVSSLVMTAAPATDLYAGFKRVLTAAIVLNVLVGLSLLAVPAWVVDLVALPPALSLVWVRYVGLFLLILTGTYVGLRLHPEANRFMANYAIALRFVFVVFFVFAGGGFLWFALYDAVFGVLLAVTYRRAFRTEVMANP